MNILLMLFFPLFSGAYTSFMDDGEILPAGQYRAYGGTQVLLSGERGVNLTSHLETALSDSTAIRAMFGVGKIDFHLGAAIKWVPIPDIDNQPAIGVRASFLWASFDSDRVTSTFLTPFLSKRFDIEHGKVNAYLGLPLGIATTASGDGSNPTGFLVGGEWETPDRKDLRIGSELNLDLSESNTYLSIFGVYYFDETKLKY